MHIYESVFIVIFIAVTMPSAKPQSLPHWRKKLKAMVLYFIFTLYGFTVIYIYIILIIEKEMMVFPGGYRKTVEIKWSRQEFTLLFFELCFVFLLHLLMETWMASALCGCLSSKIPPCIGHSLCSVLCGSSQDVGQPGLANSPDGTASALWDRSSLSIHSSLLLLTPKDGAHFPHSAALLFVLTPYM